LSWTGVLPLELIARVLEAGTYRVIVEDAHAVGEDGQEVAAVLEVEVLLPDESEVSWTGRWSVSHDIEYDLPTVLPAGYVLLGDAHSHAHMSAYASAVDKDDEAYMDGLHLVVGRVDEKRPEFHLDFVMDGRRFPLEPSMFLGDTAVDPAPLVPQSWNQPVEVFRTPYVERRREPAADGGRGGGGGHRQDDARPTTP
jgi:hypothetical protein